MTSALGDALVICRRNLLRFPRQPDLFAGYTIQPVMFVLLFVYVFGGAIRTPGFDYVDFLIPGILIQNLAFGGALSAVGLVEDMNKGLMDRFRSLPMSRAAVLAGRTFADVVVNAGLAVIVLLVGVITGFSFGAPFLHVIAGLALALLFGYAFSWIFALIGLSVKSPEAAQSFGFTAIFPLTFISSALVQTESLPKILRAFADVNPFTIAVDAERALLVGAPAGNSVWGLAAWSVGLVLVFAPLAVWRYRTVASR